MPFYRQGLDAMQKSFELIDPATTRVAVPFEGSELPAYFTRAQRPDGRPAPTMIMWNGLDFAKEHMYTKLLIASTPQPGWKHVARASLAG